MMNCSNILRGIFSATCLLSVMSVSMPALAADANCAVPTGKPRAWSPRCEKTLRAAKQCVDSGGNRKFSNGSCSAGSRLERAGIGWFGRTTSREIDRGAGIFCSSGTPRNLCGSASFSVGRSRCVIQGFAFGGGLALNADFSGTIPGINFTGTYSRVYSACSSRNETGSCNGVPGKEVIPTLYLRMQGGNTSFAQRWNGARGRGGWLIVRKSMTFPRSRYFQCRARNA